MSAAITPRYGITPRMRDLYNAIVTHISEHGCAPSYEELRAKLGLASKSPINRMMHELQDRGWIRFQPCRGRSVAVIPNGVESIVLPLSVQQALRAHCERTRENPASVVADAVALHLDVIERDYA